MDLFRTSVEKLLAHTQEKIFIKDKDLVYRHASKKFANIAGWACEEDLIGKTDFDIFEDQELAQRYRSDDLKLIARAEDLLDYVEPIPQKDGYSHFASTSKFILRDENGDFMGLVGISRDITNEYYLKRHSNRALEYLFDLPETAYFAVYMDLEEWRVINEYHQSVNGHRFSNHISVDETISRAYAKIADRRWPAAAFYRDFSKDYIKGLYDSGKREIVMEYRRIIADDETRWVRDEIHLMHDNVNGHLCAMLVVWDIHQAKLDEEERVRMAERDALTGLLNRQATMQLIQERFNNSHIDDRHALIMIDADYFKPVNDTYGHQAGDKVLANFAKEIESHFRGSDIIGRIGGDEFFVLMTHVPDREVVKKKLDTLLEKINGVHYKDIYLSASIGVSMFPDEAETLEDMYSLADKAMYAAKKVRGNIVFSEALKDNN